jgi:uncharacterized protein (DUF1501 family)
MLVPGASHLAYGAVGNGRIIVQIHLGGGLSEGAAPGTSGAWQDYFAGIYPTNPLVLNGGQQVFHSGLANIYNWFNQGKVAVVNGVYSVDNDRAHDLSTDHVLSGFKQSMRTTAVELGLGARIAALDAVNPLAAVSVNGQSTWSKGNLNPPMDIDNLNNGGERSIRWWDRFHRDRFAPARDALFAQADTAASENLSAIRAGMASVASTYQSIQSYQQVNLGVQFPNSGIANSLRDVARIIIGQMNSPVNTACFTVNQGGYDNHSGQINAHNNLLPTLDQAVHAFLQTMQAFNMLNRVVVLIMSDFGRTKVNSTNIQTAGTDHGNCQTCFVIGGSVIGGIKTEVATPAELAGRQYLGPGQGRIDLRELLAQVFQDGLALPNSIFPDRPGFGLKPSLGLFA